MEPLQLNPGEYAAEYIIEKREQKGKVEFLVKWHGYSIEESTWEPIENIIDVRLITIFEKYCSDTDSD